MKNNSKNTNGNNDIVSPAKLRLQAFCFNKLAIIGLIMFSIIVLLVIFAPMISPYGRDTMDIINKNIPPNWKHWFGTDNLGRDYFTRVMYGGRISLMVGVVAVTITTVLAVIIGGVSGYFGGWIDVLLMRMAEIILSIPFLPLMITVSAVTMDLIPAEKRMYLVMGLVGCMAWPGLARIIRGEILSLKEQEFMIATNALGFSTFRKIFIHLIPNTLGYIVINAAFGMSDAIITESALSYLGLGVIPPIPTWGNLINSARDAYIMQFRVWIWVIPGIVLFLAVLSINLIGEGLRDAFDPKSSKR